MISTEWVSARCPRRSTLSAASFADRTRFTAASRPSPGPAAAGPPDPVLLRSREEVGHEPLAAWFDDLKVDAQRPGTEPEAPTTATAHPARGLGAPPK